MSYDNLSSVTQNVLKFYQQLTGEERRMDPPLFTGKLLIKFQNILRNTTQVIIRHRVINSCAKSAWMIRPSSTFIQSYDNLSSVTQNVLKFYQQLTGEERKIPFIFDDFHFCRSRFIGLESGTAKMKIVKNERDPPLFTVSCWKNFKTFWETLLKLSYDIG
jgi:hypothetical protein